MTRAALVGYTPDLAALVVGAMGDEGITIGERPLNSDTHTAQGRLRVGALVVDDHAFTNMPALVQALRGQPDTRSLPVVVLAATERKDFERDLGWIEQVLMSFDVGELVDAVVRAVGWRRAN